MPSLADRISIVVPIYCSKESSLEDLRNCLQSLRNAEIPTPTTEIEIVLIDDGNPSTVSPLLRTVASKYEAKLVRLERNVGAGIARNAGVQVASADLLIFIDSDCIAPPKWICELTRPIYEGRCEASTACYGGPVTRTWLTLFQDDDFAYRQPNIECEVAFLNSCNMAITRQAFQSCDRFPVQRVGEDAELGMELAERGMPARFLPQASVKHSYRNSVKQLWWQRFLFAHFRVLSVAKMIGRAVLGRKRRGIISFSLSRTGLAMGTNAVSVICLGLAAVGSVFAHRTVVPILVYAVGSLAVEMLIHTKFICFVAKRHGARQALMSLLGLYITDSAYLLGSITGVIKTQDFGYKSEEVVTS